MLGQALMMQNDFVAAETALRQAIMLENANRDARKGLAKCLLAQERYKEARQMLRTILDDAPQSAEFWLLLANINIALGNPKRALTALETARRTGANTPQISLLLGDLYLNRGEIDYAAQSYQAAIQTGSPALEHILHAVAEIVRFGDVNNAHKLLTAINTGQLSPQQLRQHLQIKADLARIEGRPNEAIKLYRQLLEKAPTDGRILLSLGNAQESAGDNIAAEITYERASRVPAVKREAIIARVRLAVGNNHYPQAIKLLQQAQAIKDTSGVKRYLQELQNLQKIIDNH
jgi:tetratricopeptide (TPR) repeat protein